MEANAFGVLAVIIVLGIVLMLAFNLVIDMGAKKTVQKAQITKGISSILKANILNKTSNSPLKRITFNIICASKLKT